MNSDQRPGASTVSDEPRPGGGGRNVPLAGVLAGLAAFVGVLVGGYFMTHNDSQNTASQGPGGQSPGASISTSPSISPSTHKPTPTPTRTRTQATKPAVLVSQFQATAQPTCGSLDGSTQGMPLNLKWNAPGATKVALSIDTSMVGSWQTYDGPSGTQELPFACGPNVNGGTYVPGVSQSHTYRVDALDANGRVVACKELTVTAPAP